MTYLKNKNHNAFIIAHCIIWTVCIAQTNFVYAVPQSISATYLATIPTHYDNINADADSDGDLIDHDPTCNGPGTTLSIILPTGGDVQVSNVYVTYAMTALAGTPQGDAWMSEQRSKIYFQNMDVAETNWASGAGTGPGTFVYDRTLSIANGVYPGGTELIFEMWALRSWIGLAGCNPDVQKVDAGTWTIEVIYEINYPPVSKAGINTVNPEQAFEVAGKLKIGNDTEMPVAGTIRWNIVTEDFEGYDGGRWRSFTDKGQRGDFISDSPTVSDAEIETVIDVGAFFGRAVDIDVDHAIVGAGGKVIIYDRTDDNWNLHSELQNPVSPRNFGWSVSIDGGYAIVGAPPAIFSGLAGKAVIYKYNGSTWSFITELIASNPSAEDGFGIDVSISGDYAIVGSNVGKAYIFHYDGTSWSEQAILSGSGGFGTVVSIYGDYAVVGDEIAGSGGKLHVFHRIGSTWIEQIQLVPSDGIGGDRFGNSVNIEDNYLIVGSKFANSGEGKAYIFQRIGSSWHEQAILSPSDGDINDEFGFSVSIQGEYAIVGAHNHNTNGNSQEGKAYLYKLSSDGSVWSEYARLVAPDSGNGVDRFGRGVAISESAILIGAINYAASPIQGKLYFFSK